MDDVVIERPPEISLMGVNEDKLMRDEISRTLALGEYMSGQPQSPDEPLGKVATLIGQSNLRLSMNAQNIAVALTQVANILIQLNQEFISEDKLYRLIGKDVNFKEFKKDDKKVVVDAIVEVEPIIPPDKTTRLNQVLLMYDKFIAQDKPDPNNPEEVRRWLKRKRELQKMILEELDKEEYIELLLGPDSEAQELPQNNGAQASVAPAEGQTPPTKPVAPGPNKIQQLMQKVPIIGKMF